MNCPECGKPSKVTSQHMTAAGKRRYHRCNHCGHKCISLNYKVVYEGERRRGSSHFRSKLDEAKVVKIRELAGQGVSAFELGIQYDVDDKTIRKAVNRQTWRHVA